MPRAYDYDKFLFCPLGILLCWRYVERDSAARAALLATGVAIAGYFRYDNGVFIAAAAVVTLGAIHAGRWTVMARRLGLLTAIVALSTTPVMLIYGTAGAVYFFAQRGFAGGVVAAFGGHWSEPRNQRRMVDAFEAERPPIVAHEATGGRESRTGYSLLDEYFDAHYRSLGNTSFGYTGPDSQRFTVLARNDRQPGFDHPAWSLSCFV